MAEFLHEPALGSPVAQDDDAELGTVLVGPEAAPLPGQRVPIGVALGLFWLAAFAVAAIAAQWLPVRSPLAIDIFHQYSGPSSAHWLGTDGLGRDTLSRLVSGAQVDAMLSLGSGAIACVVGTAIGMSAAYFGGITDTVLMRAVDVLLAFPGLVLALALVAFLGPSLRNLIFVIGVVAIPAFARIARASTLRVSQADFILAARLMGARPARILRREILPNIAPSVTAFLLLFMGIAIVIEGGLSFLGLGVPSPRASWGSMIAGGLGTINTDPALALIPSGAMFLTILSLNMVSEHLLSRSNARGSLR